SRYPEPKRGGRRRSYAGRLALVAPDAHPRMHDDELAISTTLVQRTLAEQLPALAALPLREVGRGTVNAMYRLGDDLAVRLPRTAEWGGHLERERLSLPPLGERGL